jgi:CYTH domain
MAIKKLLNIVLICCAFNALGQTEIQHKYDIKKASEFSKFLRNSESIDKFKTHFHSELTYYDLYFDTPDLLLFQNSLSLRMRKKEDGEGGYAYVFQLKSEMTFAQKARMEVEERELDFYQLKIDEKTTHLAALLDELFKAFENNGNKEDYLVYEKFTSTISSWIVLKAQAPITPFQKLHFLNPEVFSFHAISTIKPQMIGKSIRKRSHIYLSAQDAKISNANSTQNDLEKDRPQFFIDNPDKTWILESSLDSAVFYPLFETDHTQSEIIEYEVENKISNIDLGKKLIQEYEDQLDSKFGLKSTIDSKYARSKNHFIPSE